MDTQYCLLDTWPTHKEWKNNYLLIDFHNILRRISYLVYNEYDIPTVFKDLSSNIPRDDDNGHSGASHSMGGGADAHFHGWPNAWNVKATWRWLSLAKKCFPRLVVFVGTAEKEALERRAGKKLDWIRVLDDGAHAWSPNEKSHFHLALLRGGPLIEWKEVSKLLV